MEKELMQDAECGHRGGCILLSFLLGGIAGAGLAMLLASKHGEGVRGRIRNLGGEARQKVEGYIGNVKAGAESAVEHGKEILEQQKSVIDRAVEAGKEILEQQKTVISNVADIAKGKEK